MGLVNVRLLRSLLHGLPSLVLLLECWGKLGKGKRAASVYIMSACILNSRDLLVCVLRVDFVVSVSFDRI